MDDVQIGLEVCQLAGESLALQVPRSMMGHELRKRVAEMLPAKAGRRLVLHHGSQPLALNYTLKQQGLKDSSALSCTFVPTDLCEVSRCGI